MDDSDARQELASDAQHIADQTLMRSSTPMSYLSAPVPDYAASLFTQSSDADESNTSFLRESLSAMSSAPARTTTIDRSRDPRLGVSRRPPGASARATSPTQRERLQRHLLHLYRMHNPPPAPVAAAYSNRTPSPTRQSIYDWAPATSEAAPLSSTAAELQGHRRSEAGDTTVQEQPPRASMLNNESSRSEMPTQVSSTIRERRRQQRSEVEHGSMRSTSPREAYHDGGFNANESVLTYFMDRERSDLSEEEERARDIGWYRPSNTQRLHTENWHTTSTDDTWSANASRRHENRRERVDALRREFLSGNVPSRTATGSPRTRSGATSSCHGTLENAVRYLDSLRHCDCYDDALAAAIDLNLTTKDLFTSKHDEFLLDLEEVEPLSRTSWLQPGAIFEGHQYSSTAILPRPRHSSPLVSVEQINPNYRHHQPINDHPPGSTQFTAYRSPHANTRYGHASRSHNSISSATGGTLLARMAASNFDHWPVRIVIHAIDPENMTLQGSMEAYNIPQHPLSLDLLRNGIQPKAGKKDSPITTYVEGQIIDLHNHSFMTLETGSEERTTGRRGRARRVGTTIFPAATPSKDVENWRKLPPFSELPEDDMAELLLSKDRLDALNQEYIFMRWKERCFVHSKHDTCAEHERGTDQDRGHGLTISGFYYISMRRSDGSIEGLYYDPHSTPYQHLRLNGVKATWPVWQFR